MINFIMNWLLKQSKDYADMKFVVEENDIQFERFKNKLEAFEKRFKEETTVAVSLSHSPREGNFVIIVGQHGNQEFINCYSLSCNRIADLDSEMRFLEKQGYLSRMDAPPNFRGCFRRRQF
jgi:hypothetical protein